MKPWNRFGFKVVFVLVLTIGILVVQTAVDTSFALAEGSNEENPEQIEIEDPVQTAEPSPEPIPTLVPTTEPVKTLEPVQTLEPIQTPEPTPTPTKTPAPKVLKIVTGVKLTRYATNAIKVTWKKHKKAKYYRVYYSRKKSGSYKCAGVTTNTHYLVKKLKKNVTYYFYVQACQAKKKSDTDSTPSAKVHMKTKKYTRKTIFAGDSICEGIGYPGWAYPYMKIGGKKKTVAYRGLNTVTFHTKRVFNGRTGLQKLISENPYRVYMMLGINEINYRKTDDMISEYKSLIDAVQQSCPNTDIVLCAISPVTKAERTRYSGYQQIPAFNTKLKKLAKQMKVRYFDYTGFLKDSGGYLKLSYAERDGYHWKMPVYKPFANIITKYEKSLDQ